MKIYLLIVLFLSLTTAGFLKANSLKRKVKEIQCLISLLENIKTRLGYFKSPVYVILSQAVGDIKGSKTLSSFKINLKKEENVKKAWLETDCENLLGEDTCFVLDEFFSLLGTSGVEGQVNLCENTLVKLNHCLENSILSLNEKGKLYQSIGVLAGAFGVILFI